MGRKIDVTLEALIPTDDYANIRVALKAYDIDVEEDVEAQTQECLSAWVKVTRILNSGMQEEVASLLIDPDKDPSALKATIDGYEGRFEQFERIISRVVTKVKSVADDVDATKTAVEELKKPKTLLKKSSAKKSSKASKTLTDK